ncbi:hypothetical protein BKK79_37005 (plasmid) [Cupriavidus sp. USMAA2-4]|uniref:DNA/RNA non-specific endonuclease n=1 Tax=Cupriavidus sp. USMAA2-4 TaxID=876364 RepID=UPI0008A6E2FB|nr:DNA/RNA non-specific endonuclease [Cupriavidus sp. USMAA2-4]AOY97541.1 hypothetical protein BKK79_37005 [Cupriavidus sp. USMAA2-4]
MNDISQQLDQLVRARAAATADQRRATQLSVWQRDPLAAEPDRSRARDFAARMGAEAIQGDSIDYLPASFLALGTRRSRAVAIVRSGTGSAIGTGFLISPQLFLTNRHVLENAADAATALVEFNFETAEDGTPLSGVRFALDPRRFWLSNPIDALDFALVAVGERLSGDGDLAGFGYLSLSDRPDKHALGMTVNLIEHPQGRRKQVVVRENRLLARGASGIAEHCLHYSADTEPGASGSPVTNDNWEVVALHHWGVPHLDTVSLDGTPIPFTVNEGIRVSAIVAQLRQDLAGLDRAAQQLLSAALALGDAAMQDAGMGAPRAPGNPPPGAHVLHLGGESLPPLPPGDPMPADPGAFRRTLMVPLEVSVRLAAPAAPSPRRDSAAQAERTALPTGLRYAERLQLDRDYGNRNGFDPHFIDGLSLSLSELVGARLDETAPLSGAGATRHGQLDYQNFSIMVCAPRRMAFVSAANIDAARYVDIDRDTGAPKVGPEGDSWYDDARMEPRYYLGQDFYGSWSTYFDRGHLTRRSDPTWGTAAQAARANADTFHRTNCTPQHFRFNESIRYWQGLERYILEFGALQDKARVSVLTGPVLDEDNVAPCDGIDVPLLFWKVVLRLGPAGQPQASAFLVSQEKLLKEARVAIKPPSDQAVPTVDTFRIGIAQLADLTGLDFRGIAAHDTYKRRPGAEAEALPMTAWEDAL